MKNNIYIQDNFFEEKFFKKLKKELGKMNFSYRYASSPKDSYGNKNYHHVILKPEDLVPQEVKRLIKKHFNYTFKSMESFYFLSFPNTKPIPHQDEYAEQNCLIFLRGDSLLNNGTGFYEKVNNEYQLHSHVGFKENRAIFFNSTIWHSPLQWAGNSTARHIMANFIHEK